METTVLYTQNNKLKMFYHSKECFLKVREADKVCPDCKGIDTIFNHNVLMNSCLRSIRKYTKLMCLMEQVSGEILEEILKVK